MASHASLPLSVQLMKNRSVQYYTTHIGLVMHHMAVSYGIFSFFCYRDIFVEFRFTAASMFIYDFFVVEHAQGHIFSEFFGVQMNFHPRDKFNFIALNAVFV